MGPVVLGIKEQNYFFFKVKASKQTLFPPILPAGNLGMSIQKCWWILLAVKKGVHNVNIHPSIHTNWLSLRGNEQVCSRSDKAAPDTDRQTDRQTDRHNGKFSLFGGGVQLISNSNLSSCRLFEFFHVSVKCLDQTLYFRGFPFLHFISPLFSPSRIPYL